MPAEIDGEQKIIAMSNKTLFMLLSKSHFQYRKVIGKVIFDTDIFCMPVQAIQPGLVAWISFVHEICEFFELPHWSIWLFNLIDPAGDSNATLLRTTNNVIGAMPEETYKKDKHVIGEQNKLYIFSDGVYEVQKPDGSMWQFKEFSDFMSKIRPGSQSRLDRLHQHAQNIRNQSNFEDDFTILEVAFG